MKKVGVLFSSGLDSTYLIWDNLKARGLSERQLEKVMGINVYNLYAAVIG